MAWTVTNEKANQIDLKGTRDNRTGTRSSTREKSNGSSTYDPGNYDVIGINGSKAKAAGDNIVASCDTINTAVDGIVMSAEKLSAAVKGSDIQTGMEEYLKSVKAYMKAVISDVKAFADKLYEVSEKWEASQKTFGGNVKDSTSTSFGETVTGQYNTTKTQAGGQAFDGVSSAFSGK